MEWADQDAAQPRWLRYLSKPIGTGNTVPGTRVPAKNKESKTYKSASRPTGKPALSSSGGAGSGGGKSSSSGSSPSSVCVTQRLRQSKFITQLSPTRKPSLYTEALSKGALASPNPRPQAKVRDQDGHLGRSSGAGAGAGATEITTHTIAAAATAAYNSYVQGIIGFGGSLTVQVSAATSVSSGSSETSIEVTGFGLGSSTTRKLAERQRRGRANIDECSQLFSFSKISEE